jgi:cysteinyl-tRNA synthetase
MILYNTLTRREEPFTQPAGEPVRIYTCGLTVYNRGHVGNFRTFVVLDVLRRTLRHHLGLDVRQVMNFTDVDDKTIAGAEKAGMPLRDYTDQYIHAFLDDARTLGLEPIEEQPRATDEANLVAMTDLIRALDARGHTYRSDGSIYFKIATFENYGRLARLDLEGLKAGARVDSDTYGKEDARDFVLWKATRPGEPTWDLGLGPGRPGWHIECSAMASRLLGELPIDIHAGGVDLIFPHHENEIAQSEGATGRPFSRFWVHVEFLNLDDEKMSKSLGNVYTVADVLERGYRASALRYLLLSVHYRKQLKFSWPVLDQAEEAVRRLADFMRRLDQVREGDGDSALGEELRQARADFGARLEEDLNVAGALGVMFDLVRTVNAAIDRGALGASDASAVRDTFAFFDRVLGVLSLRVAEDRRAPIDEAEIQQFIARRHDARRRRAFQEADAIRDELAARGVLLEDTSTGTTWKRK